MSDWRKKRRYRARRAIRKCVENYFVKEGYPRSGQLMGRLGFRPNQVVTDRHINDVLRYLGLPATAFPGDIPGRHFQRIEQHLAGQG